MSIEKRLKKLEAAIKKINQRYPATALNSAEISQNKRDYKQLFLRAQRLKRLNRRWLISLQGVLNAYQVENNLKKSAGFDEIKEKIKDAIQS